MDHHHTEKAASVSSSSTSTRLSASAKPFTFRRQEEGTVYSASADPFSSLLDSFPQFSLPSTTHPFFSSPSHHSHHFLLSKHSHAHLFAPPNDHAHAIPPKGKMQGGVKSSSVQRSNSDDYPFIFSESDLFSSAKLNNVSHSQGDTHEVICSAFISSGALDGQYFSEVPTCTSSIASDLIGSLPAEIHGLSDHCSAVLPFEYTSKNMDFLTGSWGTVDDKDYSSSIISGAKDPFVITNAEGKGIDGGDIEKPKKIGISVTFDARDHSTIATNQVMLKSDDSGGVAAIQTSKSLGDSDSDLDSPCWKGKMTSSQSPPEIVGSVQTHGIEEVKKCNTLNPLAPQFFPGNAEESSHFSGEKVKDDFLSSKFSAPIAVNMVPGENKQMKTVMADAHPVELKRVELQHSNTINESVKAHKLVGDPKCSLLLNSTCMTQPTQPVSIENLSSMEKSIVADGDVLGCSKETNDDMTKGSMRGSFRVKHHFPTPSSSYCQEGLVTSIFETLQGVPKSLIDSPKLDVQTMVNAMLILSELLVKSCVHTLDSYKNDHDRIQQIINNLNEFSSIYSGQMISAGQSVHPGNADLLGRSLDLPKLSRKGMEEANVETFAIPNKLLNQNDNGLNDVSEVIAEREQYSVTSSSDMGPQKGNEIFQVIRKNLGKNLDFEEHLDPQASLYRNLWLDAEAAMCHMRRKIYLRLIETGIDANHAELVDLWR